MQIKTLNFLDFVYLKSTGNIYLWRFKTLKNLYSSLFMKRENYDLVSNNSGYVSQYIV